MQKTRRFTLKYRQRANGYKLSYVVHNFFLQMSRVINSGEIFTGSQVCAITGQVTGVVRNHAGAHRVDGLMVFL